MTGQPYDDDDAQFDAFLQGKGPLAQGLAELTQPEPPAALDAAILARVAADLGQGAAADVQPGVTAASTRAGAVAAAPGPMASAVGPSSSAAANDSLADFRPRRWTERWRVPVALAAGVTAISIALPLWQEEVAQQQQAVHASMQEMHIPAVPAPPAEPFSPPEGTAAAPDMAAPAKDAAAATSGAGRAAARPQGGMAAPSDQSRAAAKAEAASPKAPMPAPVAASSPAAPPPPPAPAPAYARTPPSGVAPLSPLPAPQTDYRAGAPAQYPAPEAKPTLAKQLADDAVGQPLSPAAAVAHIEQLLKEGRRDAALAEWERLRTSHPDYPVPDKLREALGR